MLFRSMASARQLGGVIGVVVSGAMITGSDAVAFSQGMSNAMLLSALALLVCIGVILYVSRRP